MKKTDPDKRKANGVQINATSVGVYSAEIIEGGKHTIRKMITNEDRIFYHRTKIKNEANIRRIDEDLAEKISRTMKRQCSKKFTLFEKVKRTIFRTKRKEILEMDIVIDETIQKYEEDKLDYEEKRVEEKTLEYIEQEPKIELDLSKND